MSSHTNLEHDKAGQSAVANFSKSWYSAATTLIIGVGFYVALPLVMDDFLLIQSTIYAVMGILALSLGLVWGMGGILCFGQSAFFGLGAYSYAVAVSNMGDSTVPLLLSIVVPAAFALVLGYLIFFGRLSDVYMGVITLTVTLILFNLVNSTAGPEWTIGNAPLGGFNGIPNVAPLNVPGKLDETISPGGLFHLVVGTLIGIYALLRALMAMKFGRVVVAVKENEQRALLLGYDTRVYKLMVFVLGAAIAGLAGCFFANWGAFTSPTVFGLAQSAQIIIWVMVGGLGTFTGPVFGAILIQWLTTQLGTQQTFNASLILGAVLVVFVLLVPKGIVPSIGVALERIVQKKRLRSNRPANDNHATGGGPDSAQPTEVNRPNSFTVEKDAL